MTALTDRIAAALSEPHTAAEVEAVARDAAAAAEAARERAAAARERALDPLLAAAAVAEARAEAEAALFEADRLDRAVQHLQARAAGLAADEREAGRAAAYAAAEAERDVLARELARDYPKLAGKIAGLLQRVRASNAELAQVNDARPTGKPPLTGAEAVARDATLEAPPWGTDDRVTDLTRLVRLPSFDPRQPHWPPPAPPVVVAVPAWGQAPTQPAAEPELARHPAALAIHEAARRAAGR